MKKSILYQKSGKSMLLFWLLFLVFAQNTNAFKSPPSTITGTVKDEKNTPLQGVAISINKKTVALTNAEGKYTVTVPGQNTEIVFSYVGFQTQTVKTTGKTAIDVTMIQVSQSLDDAVVIGYGTVKRRDLTGSVVTIKAADIVRSPTSNPLEAIQGFVPGADITKTSGKAGAGVNILIRGTRSLSGSTTPLYIIDGVQGGDVSLLNPNDIESIEVLKDASSTAIYGWQGAAGIIIVTTKKGTSGKARISYAGYYGVDGWVEYPTPRLGDSYLNLRRQAYLNGSNLWSSPADDHNIFNSSEQAAIAANQWTNWVNVIKSNGIRENHTVSVSGGSDKTKVYFSTGIYKQTGLLNANSMTQYNGLVNVDQTVNSWVKAGVQAGLVYSAIDTRSSDPYSRAMTSNPLGQPYDSAGNIIVYPTPGAMSPLSDNRGPYIATNHTTQSKVSLSAHIDLEPIKGLVLRSSFGTTLTNYKNGYFYDSSSLENINTKQTTVGIGTDTKGFYNWDNVATYNKKIGDHSFIVTGLVSYTRSTDETFSGSGISAPIYAPQLYYNLYGTTAATTRVLGSGYTRFVTLSYGGRLNYSYKGKYLFTFTDRADGVSVLSAGNKWASFPSAAVAWRISDENFMKDVKAVNDLKIRFSYGVAGNGSLNATSGTGGVTGGIPAYFTQSTLSPINFAFENIAAQAYGFNTLVGNLQLGWELSKTADLGIDASLLHNRISFSADLYKTNTSKVIYLRSLPPDQGVANTYQNIGTTENLGFEIGLTTRNIQSKNFSWTTTFNFTTASEKITSLINGTNIIDPTAPEYNSLLLGHPIHSFYNYVKQGIWQTKDSALAKTYSFGGTAFKPGDIRLADLNHNNVISPDSDRTYIGSTVPKWSLGLQNSFSYKGFDLNINIIFRWGQMMKADYLGRYDPSGQTNNGPDYLNYWTPQNPSNDYPRPKYGAALSNYAGSTTLIYTDGSYAKLKTISLGYTFPHSMLKKAIDNLRAYITCNNILVYSPNHLVKYYDPERGGAEDSPLTRQLVVGLSVGF